MSAAPRGRRAVVVGGARTPFVKAFSEYLKLDTIALGVAKRTTSRTSSPGSTAYTTVGPDGTPQTNPKPWPTPMASHAPSRHPLEVSQGAPNPGAGPQAPISPPSPTYATALSSLTTIRSGLTATLPM